MIQKLLLKPAFDLDDVLAICVLAKIYKCNFVHADSTGTVVAPNCVELIRAEASELDLSNPNIAVLSSQIETQHKLLNFGAESGSTAKTVLEHYASEHIAGGVQVLLNEIQAFVQKEKEIKDHPTAIFSIVQSMNHEQFPEGLNKAIALLGDLFEASLKCIPPQK